ncbi:MAG TPA: hypothetical protein VE085_07670 [Burkholderiales bacterium]|nr:hypothetical protein [Burkholderiales bacterium]
MRTTIVLAFLLAGCAQAPVIPTADDLLHDELFAPPSEDTSAKQVFRMSEPMQRYLRDQLAREFRVKGVREALIDAMTEGSLRLQYDATMTRTAAQAFDVRAGNCLSLAIMTAAFAKALRVNLHCNIADGDTWSRSGTSISLTRTSTLSLARRSADAPTRYDAAALMTIDFLPGNEIAGLRTHEADEATVVATFLNNRAAEALVTGRVDDSYRWVREALSQGSAFMGAYNALGVVYLRRGEPALAETVFRRVLSREPRCGRG